MLGPTLAGATVTLAPIAPEHLPNYVRWFADPEITRFLARDVVPTLKQEEEWLDRMARSETDVVWGVFQDGEHIGASGIHAIDWRSRRAVTGTVVGERSRWGRGVASESMALRTRYAFEELGLEKLVTQVLEGNTASRRAVEKVGYRTVGVHRRHEFRHNQWWDMWVGELLREDWLAARRA
jgi:ribosomal-protein-alanine N-acetyltransferase